MSEESTLEQENVTFSWERSTRLEDELLRYADMLAVRPATPEADGPVRPTPGLD